MCVLYLADNSRAANTKMVESFDALSSDSSINGTMKTLPKDFDSTAFIRDHVPITVGENDIGNGEAQIGGENGERRIVLGRNIHTMCLEVTEPDIDDEVTGEREAYMASVLAKLKKSLTERTHFHLGLILYFLFLFCTKLPLFGCMLST